MNYNKKLGEVRPNQLITTYGPGSIMDAVNDSLTVLDIEYWDANNIGKEIRDAIAHAYIMYAGTLGNIIDSIFNVDELITSIVFCKADINLPFLLSLLSVIVTFDPLKIKKYLDIIVESGLLFPWIKWEFKSITKLLYPADSNIIAS